MASIRKRGSKWFVEVRKKGVVRRETFRTKTQAKIWAAEIETAIDDGRRFEQHSFHEALKRYSQEVSPQKRGKRWEQVRLNRMLTEFDDKPFDRVSPADVAEWRDRRLETVSGSTVRREMNLLHNVFTVAIREWLWVDRSPMDGVRKPRENQPRKQLISNQQKQDVFTVAGYIRGQPPLTNKMLVCAALDLALETAMRAGEIRSLSAETVDYEKRVATLPMTKNGESRQVPLSKGAIDILKSLNQERMFGISGESMSVTFRKVVEMAGHKGAFTFHDARATALTRLSNKFNIYQLARISGHKDLSMLMVYYRETASDLAKMME